MSPAQAREELPRVASSRTKLTTALWLDDRERPTVIITLSCIGCGRMGNLGSINDRERIALTVYGWAQHGCEDRE